MTTRTIRLSALLLVSLAAACGDDGNPGTNAVCGDGTREGAEQCDDGNTAAGDGCSATCTTELTMSCGNGAVEGTEQCDDGGTAGGDGCSATCQTESPMLCGNGAVDGGETCDDSNTTSGDGCSSSCQTETPAGCGNGAVVTPETCDDGNTAAGDGCSGLCTEEPGYICTGMPSTCAMATPAGTCAAPYIVNFTNTAGVLIGTATGDTTASTNQVPMATCSGIDATTGAGKDHVYRFTTTDVRDVSVSVTSTNMFDTVVRVLAAPCDPATDVDEYTGADGCDDEYPSDELLEYTALPAGTYYVVIDGYAAADVGSYSFTVTARPTLCGNGAIDPISAIPMTFDEICDDGDLMSGDGCNARCEEEPGYTCTTAPPAASVCTQTCGNSVIDAGETCDDGATVNGNGCNSVCQTEPGYICTGAPSTCMLACGNGMLNPGETCDDGDAIGADGCSATCQTEPGFVCTGTPSACTLTCGNSLIDANEECDDGNAASGDRCSANCVLEFDVAEAEPNGTTAQVLSPGDHIIKGSFTAGEVDLYRFTLTAPATVHIEAYDTLDAAITYQGVGTLTTVDCKDNDTLVHLFASTGDPTMNATALFSDDDDGDQLCSYLGPQDSAVDGGAANPNEGVLPAGTYTIKIEDFDGIAVPRYLLDLKIVSAVMAPVAGDLVINEIMAADNVSDTNCDGLTTNTFDEFVELVNVSSHTLDLAGVTIAETGAPTIPRHVFAAGTTVAPGKAIVVWAGGTPNCPGVTNFAVASVGLLSLNDDGDTVTVATGGSTPVTIATKAFTDAEAVINVSLNRSPDVTGTAYALHTAVAGAVGAFSPGKHADGTAF